MNQKVSIIILNWNGRTLLASCLQSLRKTRYADCKIVVVDNGSHDDSIPYAREHFPEAEILALPENLGFSGGCNRGIEYVVSQHVPDYVLLLNNDTEVLEPDWLAQLVRAGEGDPQTGLLSCVLVSPDRRHEDAGVRIISCKGISLRAIQGWKMPAEPYAVDAVVGAVFMIKKAVLDTIGMLDEGFSPFNQEDMDYCVRARRAGFTVKVVPSVRMLHQANASMSRQPSGRIFSVWRRNDLRFWLLNGSFPVLLLFFCRDFYHMAAHVFERIDKRRAFWPANLRLRPNWRSDLEAYAFAYVSNLRSLPEILQKRCHRSQRLWYGRETSGDSLNGNV